MDTINPTDPTEVSDSTGPVDSPETGTGDVQVGKRASLSRLAAFLVLVPAVPGLLGSIAAMVLFYVSPGRFNRLLARLPGETILRSLLFFAPSALFAVVLLAVLYAREGGRPDRTDKPASENPLLVQFAARAGLVLGVPALLAATAGLLLSFVSPVRFEAFIEPLPGTRYIEKLLPFAPLGLLFVVVPALLVVTNLITFRRKTGKRRMAGDAVVKFSRSLVLVILVPSILLLGMAVAALALSYISPPHFDKLLLRLTSEGVIRLGLMFGFSALLALVLISSLFLLLRSGGMTSSVESGSIQVAAPARSQPGWLVWLLSVGLFFTVTSSIALFGVAFYLLVR
ncbi:MAG: hypothetical protein JXA25_17910 [Anaerolineales bacterium]|nr:hypothetical protein [Anaerolineales bacterium]